MKQDDHLFLSFLILYAIFLLFFLFGILYLIFVHVYCVFLCTVVVLWAVVLCSFYNTPYLPVRVLITTAVCTPSQCFIIYDMYKLQHVGIIVHSTVPVTSFF